MVLQPQKITNTAEAIDFLAKGDSLLGLERIYDLLSRLGDPHKKLRFVHVAGTNGKGSTCAMLASILTNAGYKTGLYTSPYIVRFHERMRVDGISISDDELCSLSREVSEAAAAMPDAPTEFELITALAFLFFLRQECDIVVLEVGLGGRLDATNVIEAPELSVITSIGKDHMELLGNTISQIATEKGGIIKPGRPVVMAKGEAAAEQVIRRICAVRGCALKVAAMSDILPGDWDLSGQSFSFGELDGLRLPLLGKHQLLNAAVALTAIRTLSSIGYHISSDAIRTGLSQTRWPGRFEIVNKHPLFIVDGGHNPQCAQAIEKSLRCFRGSKGVTFITGVLADKDYSAMFDEIAPIASRFLTVTPNCARALSADELAKFLSGRFGKPCESFDSIHKAVKHALSVCGPDEVICAFGSLYIVGDILQLFPKAKGEENET